MLLSSLSAKSCSFSDDSLVGLHIEEFYPEDGGSVLFRKVDTHLPDYAVS